MTPKVEWNKGGWGVMGMACGGRRGAVRKRQNGRSLNNLKPGSSIIFLFFVVHK
jgi:hypothetical protein